MASGVASAARNGPTPPRSARDASATAGTRIKSANQPRTAAVSSRRPMRAPRAPLRGRLGCDQARQWPCSIPPLTLEPVQSDQHAQRRRQQDDRDRHRLVPVPALDLAEDVQWGRLGRHRPVAGHHHHAAEFAQRPAERQPGPGQDRRHDGREASPGGKSSTAPRPASRRPLPRPDPARAAPAARSARRTGRSRTREPARSPVADRSRPVRTVPGPSRPRSPARRAPRASPRSRPSARRTAGRSGH